MKTALISGGFDPTHDGHLELIKKASEYGQVIVALNSDEWLYRKKGYVFMPWRGRANLLEAIVFITAVTPVNDSDGTVCEALRRIRPDYFVNGGDRTEADTKEASVCTELGIEQVFGAGEKIRSSSQIVRSA